MIDERERFINFRARQGEWLKAKENLRSIQAGEPPGEITRRKSGDDYKFEEPNINKSGGKGWTLPMTKAAVAKKLGIQRPTLDRRLKNYEVYRDNILKTGSLWEIKISMLGRLKKIGAKDF